MLRAPKDPIDAVTHPNPYAYYTALRESSPVHWIPEYRTWAVVSAQAIGTVLRLDCAKVRPPSAPIPDFLHGTLAGEVFGSLARMNDGEAHAYQRERVLRLMRKVTAMDVATQAEEVVAAVSAVWSARLDGRSINEIVRRMPVMTVLAALGIRPELHEAMFASTVAWVTGLSPLASNSEQQSAIDAMACLSSMLAEHGVKSIKDAAAYIALLMQPHDGTVGLIGAGLLRLAEDVHLREAAVTGKLPWDRFGAEVLRHDPPIQNTRRTLAADATIEGTHIRPGDSVLLVLAAAARDPALYEAPDIFELDRDPGTPLALGSGAHVCPGWTMALSIAVCTWRHIVERASTPTIESLARGVSWQASVNARIPIFGTQT